MSLKDFIIKFICPNTIIRLWIPFKGGHKMLYADKDTCMEWELIKGEIWQSRYKDHEVIGVTDIGVDTYREAVNIVIKE